MIFVAAGENSKIFRIIGYSLAAVYCEIIEQMSCFKFYLMFYHYFAVFWSLITFWMPNILLLPSRQWYYSIPFIVTVRILNGAFQGVHFPAMSSITSQVVIKFKSIRIFIGLSIFSFLLSRI